MTVLPRSSVPGILWPAVPDPGTSMLLTQVWQLEQSQWWAPQRLLAHQQVQLRALLGYAAATVPHYQDSLRAAGVAVDRLDAAQWAAVPVLTRDALIAAAPRMISAKYPAQHGAVEEVLTSRTSGAPVRVHSNGILSLFWKALTLRDHQWHRRDLSGHLASIRYFGDDAPPPDGAHRQGWGPATDALAPQAPSSSLSVISTTEQQVDWLLRTNPTYLLVYPTVLDAILRRLHVTGGTLPALRQVRTISEALAPHTRALCQDVLEVPVVDTYSAQEVGYIALQCPDHEHYHVQSERLLVEILDDDGAPCRPGETGRVVVTDLHNFATPLIRYELGDHAEVGAPCPCGRGLPVLTRIVGRRRGMLVYPDGRTTWPVFTVACRQAARYRELQLVQDDRDTLRLRVVADGALDAAAPAALIAALHASLGHPFAITVEVVDALSRSPAGKLEEFVSHVSPHTVRSPEKGA